MLKPILSALILFLPCLGLQAQLHVASTERILVSLANELNLADDLSNSGTIDHLTLSGANAQSITGTGTIGSLVVNKTTGTTATITSGMQSLTGLLTPTSGILATNGNLTLLSNASGTARVATLGPGASISGDVVAERFIPQNTNSGGTGRAWRLVSIPVSGTGTLRHFFMNGSTGRDLTQSTDRAAETPNSGTPIIGHNHASASAATGAGFDWIGVANQVSSLRSFVGTQSGGTFLSSSVPDLGTSYAAAAEGYMVFTRGDRQVVYPSTSNASATTFRSTGTLKTGHRLVSVAPATASKYTLVGNPYMSVLDLSALHTQNSAVIKPSFWIWDANIAGTHKQGGYVNVYYNGTSWVTNTGTYTNPERIESGTAFFVEPVSTLATATNITIMEVHKSAATSAGIQPHGSEPSQGHGLFFVRLEIPVSGGDTSLVDGVLIDFHQNFRASLGDLSDREKMRNTISQGALWLSHEQQILAAEGMPWPGAEKRSHPLFMAGIGNQPLLLRMDPRGMEGRNVKAWLKDNHLKKETGIDMSKGLEYSFSGTGNAAADSTRFELVFVQAGRPSTGISLDPDDAAAQPSVRLHPNPSKSADVTLSLRAMAPGAYEVHILDMTGRLVSASTLDHRSANADYRIMEGRLLSPGKYLIRLSQSGTLVQTLQFIHE